MSTLDIDKLEVKHKMERAEYIFIYGEDKKQIIPFYIFLF